MVRIGMKVCVAAFLAACVFADDAFTGVKVSVSLSSSPAKSEGLDYLAKNSESSNEFVERAGKSAWREMKMMYFKLADSRLREGKTPLVRFELQYFDEGKGGVEIRYDSSDSNIGSGDRVGVWKLKRVLTLTDTREWKTGSFILGDAFFAGRCNGADFRFESKSGLTLSSLSMTAGDAAAQERNRVERANTPPQLKTEPFTDTFEQVVAKLKPFSGPTKKGSDPSTLRGKVMCGYQGWHGAPGDGSGLGWVHYKERNTFEPGDCHVDLWPDLAEFDADEKFPTPFRHPDGKIAYVHSGMNAKTVARHFRWMEEAGIDGVFVQRFATRLREPMSLNKNNTVLMNVRAAANANGRTWCLMYDFSGAKDLEAILTDFKNLVDKMQLGKDPAYQRYKGKPLVALWGLFAERDYCLPIFEKLVDLMKNDPVYGGFSIKLGVNNDWRVGKTANHERVRALAEAADIVSPWTVGRYASPEQAEAFIDQNERPDQAWCDAHGKDYMPVLFPGFSWHNMNDGTRPSDQIPRLKGLFFWRQMVAAKAAGATMFYIAMFDEIDEGTAIFKCENRPPVYPGTTTIFLTYEGLPTDHYLWLAGQGRRLLAGEIPASPVIPVR